MPGRAPGLASTYFTLAAVLAVITVPAHALALRLPWPTQRAGHVPPLRTPDRQVLASRAFLLLVTAGTLSAFALYAGIVNLVPLLTGRGMSPALAAWALGLGGAGQVAGRLCYRMLVARLGVRGRTVAVIAAGAAVTLLLGLLPGPAGLLVAVSVIAGTIRGVFTLIEATLVSDHWGPGRYAALNGVFSAPLTAASALARSIGPASPPPSAATRPCSPSSLEPPPRALSRRRSAISRRRPDGTSRRPGRGTQPGPLRTGRGARHARGQEVTVRLGAKRSMRWPSSARAASKLAGSPAGTGSGTDQCTAACWPSSSRARSHTVTTRSPSCCTSLMWRGRSRRIGRW